MAAAGQAGIARGELLGFAEDAAKVAFAFDIGGREAGSAMTGLRTIFGLNQRQAMDLASAYNHLSNNMDASAPAILRISSRASTAHEMLHLTGQQVGTLGAAFLALKTPPEIAATAINALSTRLASAKDQPPQFREALAELGLSAAGLQEHIARDGQGALLAFLEAVERTEDRSSMLFRLFGQEYVDDIGKLVGGLDTYRDALRLVAEEEADASSVEREYAARAATTANNLQLLRNRVARLGVTVGDAFLPALNSAVAVVGSFVDAGAALADRFPGATRVAVGLTAGIVGMRVAMVAGRYAGTFLGGGLADLRVAAGKASDGFAAFRRGLVRYAAGTRVAAVGTRVLRVALISTGVGAIAVALGLAAAWIVRNWEGA